MNTLRSSVVGPARRARGLVLALLLGIQAVAWAQAEPPGRVGRLAELQGRVSVFDVEEGEWAPALRNRPLTSGDRLSTEPDGRAELRIGSTVLRLAGQTELEVLRLDDERMEFQLHAGSLALRVRSREVASEITLVTEEARLQPVRSGRYRVDRTDDTTYAASTVGELRIDDEDGFVIDTGRRVELWRDGRGRSLRHAWTSVADDAFAEWVARADRDDERSAAARHVSPEMTGVEDLDRHGRWDSHPEYGSVWLPTVVAAGWAPYRQGRWLWMRPWGWTWVDEAPWGFAPFHYGRWVHWGGRWAWSPGVRVARPVFAPALVAWVGGPQVSVSISIGGSPYPAVGWVPLAPREVYVPYHPYTQGYLRRVNPPRQPLQPGRPLPPVQVPMGPIMYGNQGVPGAVTVVPQNVLTQRQPVAPMAVPRPQAPTELVARPWQPGARPPPPAGVTPVGAAQLRPELPRGVPVRPSDSQQIVPAPMPPQRVRPLPQRPQQAAPPEVAAPQAAPEPAAPPPMRQPPTKPNFENGTRDAPVPPQREYRAPAPRPEAPPAVIDLRRNDPSGRAVPMAPSPPTPAPPAQAPAPVRPPQAAQPPVVVPPPQAAPAPPPQAGGRPAQAGADDDGRARAGVPRGNSRDKEAVR